MVSHSLSRQGTAVMVSRPEAGLIGVSGLQVATLREATEVEVLGERGPYTVVTCQGLSGYVLTSDLSMPEASSQEVETLFPETHEPSVDLKSLMLKVIASLAPLGPVLALSLT